MHECVGGCGSVGYVRSSKSMSCDVGDAAAVHVVFIIYHGVQCFLVLLFFLFFVQSPNSCYLGHESSVTQTLILGRFA